MTHISAMLLDTGVPVANTTPALPLCFAMTLRVLTNMSNARSELLLGNPATRVILLNLHKFLNRCASSTNIQSMPNCSKDRISSFLFLPDSFASFASHAFFARASSLMMRLPRSCFSARMASSMRSISFWIYSSMNPSLILMRSNEACVISTPSQSPVAIRERS